MMNQLVCSISFLDSHRTSQFNVLLLTKKPEHIVGEQDLILITE